MSEMWAGVKALFVFFGERTIILLASARRIYLNRCRWDACISREPSVRSRRFGPDRPGPPRWKNHRNIALIYQMSGLSCIDRLQNFFLFRGSINSSRSSDYSAGEWTAVLLEPTAATKERPFHCPGPVLSDFQQVSVALPNLRIDWFLDRWSVFFHS